jgi:hypothetical protein
MSQHEKLGASSPQKSAIGHDGDLNGSTVGGEVLIDELKYARGDVLRVEVILRFVLGGERVLAAALLVQEAASASLPAAGHELPLASGQACFAVPSPGHRESRTRWSHRMRTRCRGRGTLPAAIPGRKDGEGDG